MISMSSTNDAGHFDPQVHLSFSLSFQEREQLKQLASTQGCSVEQLLQEQVKALLQQRDNRA